MEKCVMVTNLHALSVAIHELSNSVGDVLVYQREFEVRKPEQTTSGIEWWRLKELETKFSVGPRVLEEVKPMKSVQKLEELGTG